MTIQPPPTPLTEGQILTILIEWLGNVRARNPDAYLSAMPNNVPGLPALQERREAIVADEAERRRSIEERCRLRAEQQARNAPGAVRTRALRCSPGNPSQPGYVGVVEVRSPTRRWLRWVCPHLWGTPDGPHRSQDMAVACAESHRHRGQEEYEALLARARARD